MPRRSTRSCLLVLWGCAGKTRKQSTTSCTPQQKSAPSARLEAAAAAQLEKGINDVQREAAAAQRHAAQMERIAAKGTAESDKVERANARLKDEANAKAIKLQERLAAAEERKSAIQYPPCSRAPKVKSQVVSRKAGPLRKLAIALAGGMLARGLVFWGTKMRGFASIMNFGSRLIRRAA